MSPSVEDPALEDSAATGSGGRSWSSDGLIVGVVVVGFVAPRLLWGLPWQLLAVLSLGCVATLRPRFALGGLLLAVALHSSIARNGLTPSPTRPVEAEQVRLIEDPRPGRSGWRALADVDGQTVVITARLPAAGRLRTASVGDRVRLSGTLRGSSPQTDWAIGRRVVGQLSITSIDDVEPAGGVVGAANLLRDAIRDGAESVPFDRRVLFTGLVFGDDRGQGVIVADNFRAAGLGHLLAVSGQNVVFVLILAAPLLTRLRSAPVRVGVAFAILAGFGFLTRFEASVTRAIVMAGLALVAHAVGRPSSAPAVLPPAVLGLLLLDPLLAWSLAFQLSVAATLGLIVLAPRLSSVLPGPEALRLAIAATLSAQLFVSPLLFATFGQVSVVAVPANLLAAPAAAGAMMWGLGAGTIAGIGPPWLAEAIHLPTRAMLWWIDGVAARAARVDVGQFTPWHLGVLVSGVSLWRWLLPRRWFGAVLVVVAVLSPLITPRQLPAGNHVLAPGVSVARSSFGHDVLVIGPEATGEDLVQAVRQARLGRIDLVIATSGARPVGVLVALVQERFEVVDTWAPLGHHVPGARVVEPLSGSVGSLRVEENSDEEVVIYES